MRRAAREKGSCECPSICRLVLGIEYLNLRPDPTGNGLLSRCRLGGRGVGRIDEPGDPSRFGHLFALASDPMHAAPPPQEACRNPITGIAGRRARAQAAMPLPPAAMNSRRLMLNLPSRVGPPRAQLAIE